VSRRVAERDKAPPGQVTDSGPSPITRIGPLGKPVGAVVAAAKVLRALHASERPLNASEVARAAGLHRGTAYNILRTLQAAGFVGYDEATRTYAVSLHILELAYGVLRRSGLIDIARPLMHAVSDAHAVLVYLSKLLQPSSLLLLDWVGVALRPDPHVTVGRRTVAQLVRRASYRRLRWQQRTGVGGGAFAGPLVRETLLSGFFDAGERNEAIRLRGGSRHDVPRCHASVGADFVALMGAVADPYGGGTLA
jgi:IclR helix-turn-helix domain